MSFGVYRYLLMTVDPVHIGTGGYRLGRVDLSIVREPGTRLPKIPGTSLSGAIRSYAAYRYGKPRCAGQGQPKGGREEETGHCGRPTCPICYTFGSVRGERAYSGVVSIGDARILLFPVYSMAGPVWVSTEAILREVGFAMDKSGAHLTTMTWDKPLNLGWLMIEKPDGVKITPPKEVEDKQEWKTIQNRIVLVSDKLFSQIVNSNLEVRTSVSISPETGAAEEGALFTYEAIPRATFLWMDVVVDDYRGMFPSPELLKQWSQGKLPEEKKKRLQEAGWTDADVAIALTKYHPEELGETASKVITTGLEWAEHLGIGGMGTRGFGRIRKIADWRC
ncbi:MAG: type III-B CRISPR module RAMP protein Cmr4 [Chloroflexi bacterium]|nr:MAG: type III-B CRISPR module RAMP protein Cmr4 [Chloroflexota bacterium]